jgi:hypothetical protein
MAKQLELKGRQYWILSEPDGNGWKATAVEVRDDGSSHHHRTRQHAARASRS